MLERNEKICFQREKDVRAGNLKSDQFGIWLKAENHFVVNENQRSQRKTAGMYNVGTTSCRNIRTENELLADLNAQQFNIEGTGSTKNKLESGGIDLQQKLQQILGEERDVLNGDNTNGEGGTTEDMKVSSYGKRMHGTTEEVIEIGRREAK